MLAVSVQSLNEKIAPRTKKHKLEILASVFENLCLHMPRENPQ